jgi:cell filamentation protein
VPGYTLPDGFTLKNKFGETDEGKLAVLEADAVRRRLFELELEPPAAGNFDAEHLKAIHGHLFQDAYEWAGHTRDERVTLSDGTIATEPILSKPDGQPFLAGPAIPAALDDIGAKLRESDNLRGLSREEFAERAADVMIELNNVHPFREGNGRTQRTFIRELAKEAGHNLDFSVVSQERMVQASIAAHEQNDPSMMRRMFDEISNPERAALLRDGIEKLQAAFDRNSERTGEKPAHWNDIYLATVTPGHNAELVLAGVAGSQFMARTGHEILFGKTSDLPEPRPERGQTFALAHPSQGQERQRDSKDDSEQPRGEDQLQEDLRKTKASAAEIRNAIDDGHGRGRPRGGGRGR